MTPDAKPRTAQRMHRDVTSATIMQLPDGMYAARYTTDSGALRLITGSRDECAEWLLAEAFSR